jgi:hypothetical protein
VGGVLSELFTGICASATMVAGARWMDQYILAGLKKAKQAFPQATLKDPAPGAYP